jgi:nucleotide-binding universal stress UspA family protein
LAIGGAVFGVVIYLLSGARPQKPDLDEFLDGDSPAWYSPPLLARIRGLPSAAPAVARAGTMTTPVSRPTSVGPVVFAFDGSELAECAITHAASQLPPGRCAVVVCVWQSADVGFTPVDSTHLDAGNATQVRQAAEKTAAHGASLAARAGFEADSMAVEAAPTWKGIVKAADELDASLIVLGPHRRSGLLGPLQGSVAGAVIAHTTRAVLVVPEGCNGQLVSNEIGSAAAVSA